MAAWQLSLITGESGSGDFFWPLILRGIGLGLMFVPLTTITLAELSSRSSPQGTGLYNFFRQLGGSFGIAGIATLLSRYTAQYHAVLAEHITNIDATSTGRLRALTQRHDGPGRGRVDGEGCARIGCWRPRCWGRRASLPTPACTS